MALAGFGRDFMLQNSSLVPFLKQIDANQVLLNNFARCSIKKNMRYSLGCEPIYYPVLT